MTAPILARDISDQQATKPLGKFGKAVVRHPIREGRARAGMDDALEQRKL